MRATLTAAALVWGWAQTGAPAENLVRNPGFESGSQDWRLEGAARVVNDERRAGASAMLLPGMKKKGEVNRAIQSVILDQDRPEPIRAGVWLKAAALQRVSGKIAPRRTLIVALDCVLHYTDGSARAVYNPTRIKRKAEVGKWIYKETVLSPEKPVARLDVLLLNQVNGADAWFDDLLVERWGRPAVRAARTAAPPVLDGRLDDACWASAGRLGPFSLITGQGAATPNTEVFATYDAGNLYVAARCREPDMAGLVARYKQRDDKLWRDDCLEFFFDPEADEVEYFHLAVNPNGAQYDAECSQGGIVSDKNWNGDWRVSVAREEQAWTVEAAFPFHMFKIGPRAGAAWRWNVCRERSAGGAKTVSAWSPTHGRLHSPRRFGLLEGLDIDFARLRLEVDVAPRLADVGLRPDNLIGAALKWTLLNDTGLPVTVAEIVALEPTPAHVGATPEPVRLAPGQKVERRLDLACAAAGALSARVRAGDAATGEILAVGQRQLDFAYAPVRITAMRPADERGIIQGREEIASLDVVVQVDPQLAGRAKQCEVALTAAGAAAPVASLARPVAETVAVSLPLKSLAPGQYALTAKVDSGAGAVLADRRRLIRLDPARRAVAIRGRCLEVDGAPFLPFGLLSVPPDEMSAYAAKGYNAVFSFVPGALPGTPQAAALKALLDAVAQAGLKTVIYPFPGYKFIHRVPTMKRLSAEDEEAITNVVNAWKDHPGLLSWYLADEPECHDTSPEVLREIHQLVQTLDPYHPTVVVNNTVSGQGVYAGCSDIAAPDVYIWYAANRRDYDLSRDRVVRSLDAARQAAPQRPLWVLPQSFNGRDMGGRPQDRGPDFWELRAVTYTALIHGATGVFYYTYISPSTDHPSLRIGMERSLLPEIKVLAPALLSPEEAPVQVSSAEDKVHALLKRCGGHVYLFAANTFYEERAAAFQADAFKGAQTLRVLGEDRTVELTDGGFEDAFAAHAVHLYTTDPEARTPLLQEVLDQAEAAARALHKPGNLAYGETGATTEHSSMFRWHDSHLLLDGLTSGRSWWRDATWNKWPDWVEVTLPAAAAVSRAVVHTGTVTAGEIQVWQEGQWLPAGSFQSKPDQRVEVRFEPVSTTKVRLLTKEGSAPYSLIYEIELYE